MISFPPPLSHKARTNRFSCLNCSQHIALEQEKCEHCGKVITEEDRTEMKKAFQALGRKGKYTVLAVWALIILFIYVLIKIV